MDNEYYIYLRVPEYTRQWAIFHFGNEEKDAVNTKNWYVLNGFMIDNLRRNTSGYHFTKGERYNLKIIVPDSRMKRKKDYNYMMANARLKMAKMIREIMFAQFWQFVLPSWNTISMDRRHRNKAYTFDKCIMDFFDHNGIEYSEQASNSFKKEFARQRKILNQKYGIKI